MATGKLALSKSQLVAFTSLLQNPAITAGCTENCGCNEACGCKKDHCCEAKCACDGKGASMFVKPEDLLGDPDYLKIVKQFDPAKIQTIQDFRKVVAELQTKFKGGEK